MKQSDKNHIIETLNILKNTKINFIGRIAASGNICFVSEENEYSIHVQTAFRVIKDGEIIFANLDMFEPSLALESNPNFDFDTFDWDTKGLNLFDE